MKCRGVDRHECDPRGYGGSRGGDGFEADDMAFFFLCKLVGEGHSAYDAVEIAGLEMGQAVR